MLHRLVEAGARGGGALRGVLVGGGPADPELLRRALAAGIPALQTYGMTETCSQVCTVAPRDAERDLGTAGRPLRGAEVAIGTDGRIQVRGPMVSGGYLGEAPRDDAWFVTGDLGEIDPAGRLVVFGRADAVIVTGGENVSPMEVERVLRRIPGVVDVRVFGEPDPEWGQRVVAEVVLADVDVETVSRQARAGLRPAEVPRRWQLTSAIERKLA
jgi:O-succinylbenzoic acid--CoA ligase